jgi:hypothetical protein
MTAMPYGTPSQRGLISTVVLSTLNGASEPSCAQNADVMAHEIMHGLGMPQNGAGFKHVSNIACTTWPQLMPPYLHDPFYNRANCGIGGRSDATFFAYGSYSVTGSYRGHPTAFEKRAAGWLSASQYRHVPGNGSSTIDPIEIPSGGVKVVEVPLGMDQMGVPASYWLEYRSQRPVSIEDPAVIMAAAPDRVRVWVKHSISTRVPDFEASDIRSTVLFAFSQFSRNEDVSNIMPNGVYHDPYRGVRIAREPNVEGAFSAARVTVSRSSLRVLPSIATTVRAGTTQAIVVTNDGTTPVQQSTPVVGGRDASAFRIVGDSCGGRALAPGQSCTIQVTHLRCTASDGELVGGVEWTSSDPIRSTPAVAIRGVP